jgi:hypothetical protein
MEQASGPFSIGGKIQALAGLATMGRAYSALSSAWPRKKIQRTVLSCQAPVEGPENGDQPLPRLRGHKSFAVHNLEIEAILCLFIHGKAMWNLTSLLGGVSRSAQPQAPEARYHFSRLAMAQDR